MIVRNIAIQGRLIAIFSDHPRGREIAREI